MIGCVKYVIVTVLGVIVMGYVCAWLVERFGRGVAKSCTLKCGSKFLLPA